MSMAVPSTEGLAMFMQEDEITQEASNNMQALNKSLSLPENFAKKIIVLELICERLEVTHDSREVQELADLYTVSQIFSNGDTNA